MNEKANNPIMPALKKLKKGESISFDLNKISVVRSTCSLLSLQNDDLKFKTKSDRETRAVTVERL